MTNSQLEMVVGGAGKDTITAGVSQDDQFMAGGAGADTFRVRYGADEGVRVVWGGAGADRFEFVFPTGDPNETWQSPAGILVVNVAGLTMVNFAALTLDMLGLSGIDLSMLAAIVLNPDGQDRFFVNGMQINAATLAADPNLQPDDGGSVFTTRATDWLGPDLMVQAIFQDRTLITPTPDVIFFELGISEDDDEYIVVNGQTIDEGTWGVVWGSEGAPDLLMTQDGRRMTSTRRLIGRNRPTRAPTARSSSRAGPSPGRPCPVGAFGVTAPPEVPGLSGWLLAA